MSARCAGASNALKSAKPPENSGHCSSSQDSSKSFVRSTTSPQSAEGRIILAKRAPNAGGYTGVVLEAVDRIDPEETANILGLFKHTTQAKEFLAAMARSHRLCPKLLHLEQARTYCFSHHLGRCDGACMGEEDPESYNLRVEEAFEERRIKAWPYDGPVVIEEHCEMNGLREKFVIDNWCLVGGSAGGEHRFDYDSYKILYAYLSDGQPEPMTKVQVPIKPQ